MKRTIFTVAGIVVAGIIGFAVAQKRPAVVSPESALPSPQDQFAKTQEPAPADSVVEASRAPRAAEPPVAPANTATYEATPAPATETKPAKPAVSLVFNQALETLTLPQAGFLQRQTALKQLRDAGQLDRAITELEQRATANPQAPEYPAALGQAYLQKAGSIKDVREQGILGLKADQTFDAALQLDPGNWEARFWKTAAMAHWPTSLGKGNEVVDHFITLISQQETQSPQPHFAQTYALLGDYYQKLGHADHAQQVWQRGATLFPTDTSLQEKAAPAR